ncbi:MAG TPA: hypothetical protein VGF11_04950 [Acidimicrobiales bacterium]
MRVLLVALCALFLSVSIAHANVDGSVPSPGNCDYPGTGTFGAAGGEYDFGCAFPTEVNGSHWQVLFGGGMWQVSAGLQFSILMISVNAGVTVPAGVLRGITYWACPDLSFAEQPNPVGGWNNKIHPTPCKTVGPRPILIRPGEEMPTPPPGVPPPPPPPPDIEPVGPPQQPQTGAQTNPTPGNPVAPDSGSKH